VEIEGLDEGMALQQRGREVVELGARDRRAEGKQLVRHRDHLDRVVQALAHRGHALVGALVENASARLSYSRWLTPTNRATRGGQAGPERESRRAGE
jgi:hypothetical protein